MRIGPIRKNGSYRTYGTYMTHMAYESHGLMTAAPTPQNKILQNSPSFFAAASANTSRIDSISPLPPNFSLRSLVIWVNVW